MLNFIHALGSHYTREKAAIIELFQLTSAGDVPLLLSSYVISF